MRKGMDEKAVSVLRMKKAEQNILAKVWGMWHKKCKFVGKTRTS